MQGYTVRGTVRSLSKKDAVIAGVKKVSDKAETIEFVEADLLDDAGWEAACPGVTTCSTWRPPSSWGEPDHPDDLIRPAVEGTNRVLAFAKEAGVKQTDVTSSTVAISSDKVEGVAGPDDWADPNVVSSYAKSKILAERAAWDFVATADSMELVVINPGGVMGPIIDGHANGNEHANGP